MNIIDYYSKSVSETFDIARLFSEKATPGMVILLEGSLGAGKSVFVRGFLSGLGINEAIPSPTFTLVNEYNCKFKIYHFDFYRLNDPYELYEIGFEDYVYSNGISLIEWASKGGDLIPLNAYKVNIEIKSLSDRNISITIPEKN